MPARPRANGQPGAARTRHRDIVGLTLRRRPDMKLRLLVLALLPAATAAQSPSLSKEVKEFVSVDAPAVVLRHVRVIDGTGAAAKEDQSLVIAGGRIEKIGSSNSVETPSG